MNRRPPLPDRQTLLHYGAAILLVVLLVAVGLRMHLPAAAAEVPHVIPAPALDEKAGQASSETAVLAGGCFWGVQGVFQHVKGVTSAVSGYAGGSADTAEYRRWAAAPPVTPSPSR